MGPFGSGRNPGTLISTLRVASDCTVTALSPARCTLTVLSDVDFVELRSRTSKSRIHFGPRVVCLLEK